MGRLFFFVLGWLVALAGSSVWAEPLKSSAADQKELSLTVYNLGLGLVKEVRRVTLPEGEGELRFMDVASGIMPETVRAKSLTAPNKLMVLEQNYEYDLISRRKLLDRYVGARIKLLDFNPYQDKKEAVTATLIANHDGEVYEIEGEIFLGHPGVAVLPRLPDDLIAQPTLDWLFSNGTAGVQDLEVAYLTRHINWRADYVLTLDEDDKSGDMSGWVTVDNQSGATYKDAILKVVAGKPNVAPEPEKLLVRAKATEMVGDGQGMAPQFSEQALFEYHMYDLKRRITIKDRQAKQVKLLDASGILINKEFVLEAQTGGWYTRQFNDLKGQQPVDVVVRFKNSEDGQLGIPLPAGVVRLYKRDWEGNAQFIGEDNIGHTPKDEEVRLKVGEAFDVVAERRQTAFQRVSSRMYESSWEITIRNHKTEDIVVYVVEPLAGFSDWVVLQNSHALARMDASRIRFEVPVAKEGTTVLTYTARVNY